MPIRFFRALFKISSSLEGAPSSAAGIDYFFGDLPGLPASSALVELFFAPPSPCFVRAENSPMVVGAPLVLGRVAAINIIVLFQLK